MAGDGIDGAPAGPARGATGRPDGPLLSVILPVHGVQGYLRACLASILVPGVTDLEVVAVDDASPDHCGAILDEVAANDPRLRVLHLVENVGLGEARNLGLGLATGEYVWFFDSDDHAAQGAVEAILHALERTRPDVLMFDYARDYWTGRYQRNVMNDLFRVPPPPEVFTAEMRPSVLRLLMTAWNRAIRRDFLLGLGLRFGRGYYEDLNLTYPLLMAAQRISLLDRVCYVYRQRRRGAITRTTDPRHFDSIDQYAKVFEFIDRSARYERFRGLMFDRMIWHLLVILDKPDRLAEWDRHRFFAEVASAYRRYMPPGHTPSDTDVAADPDLPDKYAALAADDYAQYARIVRRAHAVRRMRRRVRRVRSTRRRTTRRVKGRAKLALYHAELRRPIDETLAVYTAYWNRGYLCSPAAIYERQRELFPDIRGVWVVRARVAERMPPGVPYVVFGTPAYYRLIARARFFVNNVNFADHMRKRRGQLHLMTQHGTPLKAMGLDQREYPVGAKGMNFQRLMRRSDRWDYLLSSNPFSSEVWERSYPADYALLETGYPRNDRLVRHTERERARLREQLGLSPGVTAILYTPTHREYLLHYRPMFDIARLADDLGDDHVILVRAHYFHPDGVAETDHPRVLDVSDHPSIEALSIASDLLLTDYSSTMFDYALLDRPIVLYLNDLDTYTRTRGLNLDPRTIPPGPIATTPQELTETLASGAAHSDTSAKQRAEFRRVFCPWDDGAAAERAVNHFFTL